MRHQPANTVVLLRPFGVWPFGKFGAALVASEQLPGAPCAVFLPVAECPTLDSQCVPNQQRVVVEEMVNREGRLTAKPPTDSVGYFVVCPPGANQVRIDLIKNVAGVFFLGL